MITEYDKTEVFKKEIEPTIKKLMTDCSLNNIPCFLTFAIKNSKQQTDYYNDMVSAITNDITLKDDHIVKMANVHNGFDVISSNKVIEIEI